MMGALLRLADYKTGGHCTKTCAHSGESFIDMCGTTQGAIEQKVATTKGVKYSLTLAYDAHAGCQSKGATSKLDVLINNRKVKTLEHVNEKTWDLDWATDWKYVFEADGPTTVRFNAVTGGCGCMLLDSIELIKVSDTAKLYRWVATPPGRNECPTKCGTKASTQRGKVECKNIVLDKTAGTDSVCDAGKKPAVPTIQCAATDDCAPYDPCLGKITGNPCTMCDPEDVKAGTCEETLVPKTCQASRWGTRCSPNTADTPELTAVSTTDVTLTTKFSASGQARCVAMLADDPTPTAKEVMRGVGAVGQAPAAKMAWAKISLEINYAGLRPGQKYDVYCAQYGLVSKRLQFQTPWPTCETSMLHTDGRCAKTDPSLPLFNKIAGRSKQCVGQRACWSIDCCMIDKETASAADLAQDRARLAEEAMKRQAAAEEAYAEAEKARKAALAEEFAAELKAKRAAALAAMLPATPSVTQKNTLSGVRPEDVTPKFQKSVEKATCFAVLMPADSCFMMVDGARRRLQGARRLVDLQYTMVVQVQNAGDAVNAVDAENLAGKMTALSSSQLTIYIKNELYKDPDLAAKAKSFSVAPKKAEPKTAAESVVVFATLAATAAREQQDAVDATLAAKVRVTQAAIEVEDSRAAAITAKDDADSAAAAEEEGLEKNEKNEKKGGGDGGHSTLALVAVGAGGLILGLACLAFAFFRATSKKSGWQAETMPVGDELGPALAGQGSPPLTDVYVGEIVEDSDEEERREKDRARGYDDRRQDDRDRDRDYDDRRRDDRDRDRDYDDRRRDDRDRNRDYDDRRRDGPQ